MGTGRVAARESSIRCVSRIDRRHFLKMAGAASLAAALPAACRTHTSGPLNLLFVMADQWRSDAFGSVPGSGVSTPQIDRFASESVRWTRAYSVNPVCSPSRASIMTGRYPHQHGVITNNLTLPPGERGLAQSFRESGYATHYVGKWHLDGPETPGFVGPGWRRRGFETFEGFNRGHRYKASSTYSNDGELLTPGDFEATYQTSRAIEFMRSHRDRPFFCFLSWGPPHPPKFGFATPVPDDVEFTWPSNVPGAMRRKLRRYRAGYNALCEALDKEMGRLLAAVEELGLRERTVVVFTSDHGDMLGAHGLAQKDYPFEESLRVPLMLRLPRGGSADVDQPVSSVDLMPTLTALCGLESLTTCAGRDLSTLLEGNAFRGDESVYCQGRMVRGGGKGSPWRALITRTHKLVVESRAGQSKVVLLADLARDPLELHDLKQLPEHESLRQELFARLESRKSELDDPFPQAPTSALARYPDT